MSTGNHQLAQWNSISAAGAVPQAQLIMAHCRCNYHTLKATIVARSTFSVNKQHQSKWSSANPNSASKNGIRASMQTFRANFQKCLEQTFKGWHLSQTYLFVWICKTKRDFIFLFSHTIQKMHWRQKHPNDTEKKNKQKETTKHANVYFLTRSYSVICSTLRNFLCRLIIWKKTLVAHTFDSGAKPVNATTGQGFSVQMSRSTHTTDWSCPEGVKRPRDPTQTKVLGIIFNDLPKKQQNEVPVVGFIGTHTAAALVWSPGFLSYNIHRNRTCNSSIQLFKHNNWDPHNTLVESAYILIPESQFFWQKPQAKM